MSEVCVVEHAHIADHPIAHRRGFTRTAGLWRYLIQPMLVKCPRIITSDVRHGLVFDHRDERVDRPALDLFPLLSLSWAFASNLICDNLITVDLERLANPDIRHLLAA